MGASAPRRGARVVTAEFQYMLLESKRNGWETKCETNPAPYADYAKTPTPEEARELCEGCPMLKLCKEYGVATRPAWTVLGGVAYVDGRPQNKTLSEAA